MRIFNAGVLPVFLFAAESWTLRKEHYRLLESAHFRLLLSLIGKRRRDRLSHVEVLDITGTVCIKALIRASCLTYLGKVFRMPPSLLPQVLLFGELTLPTAIILALYCV